MDSNESHLGSRAGLWSEAYMPLVESFIFVEGAPLGGSRKGKSLNNFPKLYMSIARVHLVIIYIYVIIFIIKNLFGDAKTSFFHA